MRDTQPSKSPSEPDARPATATSGLTRRAFLVSSAGLVVAAACGKKKPSASAGSTTTGNGRGQLQGALASSDLYVGPPQRFAFGIIDPERGPVNGGSVTVAFGAVGAQPSPAAPATFHGEGLEGRGVYVLPGTFGRPGNWEAHVTLDGKAISPVAFQVLDKPVSPAPGQPAPKAPSPTAAAPLGVNPICTRTPQPCPLHSVSLDRAVGSGKPVAVIFATPARCQSRFCGPTLEMVLQAVPNYGDRITFVHVEIFKDLQSQEFVPTLGPWSLQSEPWLYTIDSAGNVKDRADGAFDAAEVKAMLDALVA